MGFFEKIIVLTLLLTTAVAGNDTRGTVTDDRPAGEAESVDNFKGVGVNRHGGEEGGDGGEESIGMGRAEGEGKEKGWGGEEDEFFIDPIISQGSPSYRLNKVIDGLKERILEASNQGSNCMEVGGGYSPKYSLCEGCMISSALQCVEDMRTNSSANVRGGCDLQALMVEPQPDCCTKFGFPDTGVQIKPQTSAYNDALLCLERSDCKCLDGGLDCDEGDQHDIYKNLQAECWSHTVHQDCRTSCSIWIHDGAEPIGDRTTGDCQEWNPDTPSEGGCWEYFDPPTPPKFKVELPQCERGTDNFARWRDGGTIVNGRVEVRAQYDWWYCWYAAHCLFSDGRRKYPPLAHEDTGKLLTAANCTTNPCVEVYGKECSPEQQMEHDDAIADGRTPDFDCMEGGIPTYCDTSFNTVVLADGTVIQTPRGILIPPDTVEKNEDIDCKVDVYACLPTKSGASGVWWGGWLLAGLCCGVLNWILV